MPNRALMHQRLHRLIWILGIGVGGRVRQRIDPKNRKQQKQNQIPTACRQDDPHGPGMLVTFLHRATNLAVVPTLPCEFASVTRQTGPQGIGQIP